eukprot:2407577-Pleurochrysis_carterae.AAC.1
MKTGLQGMLRPTELLRLAEHQAVGCIQTRVLFAWSLAGVQPFNMKCESSEQKRRRPNRMMCSATSK